MANSKNTTDAIWSIDATGDLETHECTIQAVIYTPATATGDDFILTDTSDNVLFGVQGTQNVSGFYSFGDRGRKVSSLKVGTIDSGQAYVILRKLP